MLIHCSHHANSDYVRQSFPNAEIYNNEAVPVLSQGVNLFGDAVDYTVPSSLSLFSIDLYHFDGPDPAFVSSQVQAFYTEYVYPLLSPGQLAMLVPGSYGSLTNPACNLTCYDAMCTVDAWNFIAWANSDPMIAGLAVWNWSGCPGCVQIHDEIGTVMLNSTATAWMQIGAAIKNT